MKAILTVVLLNLFAVAVNAQEKPAREIIDVGLRSQLHYDNGERMTVGEETRPYTGLYKRFNSDSTVITVEGQYLNGKRNGVWKEFYIQFVRPGTGLKSLKEYNNGILLKATLYSGHGSMEEEQFYNAKGQRDGEWKYYRHGELSETKIFENGELTNVIPAIK